MSRRRTRRLASALAALALALLALPGAAHAHAALLRTVPSASGLVNTPPQLVELTFSEAVEPRFASVSVSDAQGRQATASPPRRSPRDADTLQVPLRALDEGWYLVYWRVVSVDGHPVRGAYTFAVGPNPGPPPRFVVPSVSETAATPRLLVTRWVALLSAMAAIGLALLRLVVARPLARREPASAAALAPVSRAFAASAAVALVATPLYVLFATAQFSLRSASDVGALVPLLGVSAFGRGYLRLELCLALFTLAAAIAIAIDRPRRERRSIAELAALAGALLAAAAALLVPGLAGHAGQTAPRGVSVALDWLHLSAGAIWIGGLLGLLALAAALAPARRTSALAVVVPRFSNVALGSVAALIASGTLAAIVHLPTLASLWQTAYGTALLVKIAALIAILGLASLNLLRTRPRLRAGDAGAPALLRRLLTGEALLVAGTIFAAAWLTSLAPPAKAAADLKPVATVGPGPVAKAVTRDGYRLALRVAPNRAAVPNHFGVTLTRGGRPVAGATVTASFTMLDMEMGQQAYKLTESAPGVYGHDAPALVMVGRWGLELDVEPRTGRPFSVSVLDHADG